MRPTGARLGLLTLLAGAPVALGAALGPPGIPSLGSSSGLSGSYVPLEVVLETLGLLAWGLWAYLAFTVLLHTVAIVASARGLGPHKVLIGISSALTPKVVRQLVELAAGGVLLAASISVRVAASDTHPHQAAAAIVRVRDGAPQESADVAAPRRSHRETYRVRAGDSLWRIAERELGSGFRWREIFDLNRGRHFHDGRSLTNPHLIHPGWALELPRDGKGPSSLERGRADDRGQDEREMVEASPGVTEDPESIRGDMSPADTRDRQPGSPAELESEQREPEEGPAPQPAISLPSGLVVAASFASGLLTAHLLGRLRRRRSRRLSDAAPQEPLATPELIQDLRRAGASQMASTLDVALDAVIDAWREATDTWPVLLAVVEAERQISAILRKTGVAVPNAIGGTLSPRVRFVGAGKTMAAQVDGPFPPRLRGARTLLERGLLVPLGQAQDGSAVHISLTALGPVSVTGPNAESLARQLILASATRGGPKELRMFLLGASADWQGLAGLPQVVASQGWEQAPDELREIQFELLRRARLFLEEGVEEIGGHLADHADERLPALLVVTPEPPPTLRGLVEALGREGSPLGAAMLAVGWTPPSSRLQVRAGATLEVEAEIPCPKVLNPFVLDARAEEQAIEVILQAFPAEPEDEDASVHIETAPEVGTPTVSTPVAGSTQSLPPASGSSARVLPTPREPPEPPLDVPAVRCLGPLEISRSGTVLATGWKSKSRELLAYLAAHPAGAAKERIIEELWPEIEPGQGVARFDRAASLVRTQARGTESSRAFLERVGDSYRLEKDAWWVDAWEFERLIREAGRSEDLAEGVAKLRDAVGLYRAQFCDDQYYSWAEPIRERYRALFVEASARLADLLLSAGENEEALSVLDRAIRADPVCEDLTRRAMAIEVSVGRRAAALSRYRKLEAILEEELGVDPDPETQAFVGQLVPQKNRRATG
jgi:DNA-binding SARP family transcriptional activator